MRTISRNFQARAEDVRDSLHVPGSKCLRWISLLAFFVSQIPNMCALPSTLWVEKFTESILNSPDTSGTAVDSDCGPADANLSAEEEELFWPRYYSTCTKTVAATVIPISSRHPIDIPNTDSVST